MTPKYEREHDDLDVADSYALLDDGQVIAETAPLDDWDNDTIREARRRYRRNVRGDRPVRQTP